MSKRSRVKPGKVVSAFNKHTTSVHIFNTQKAGNSVIPGLVRQRPDDL